MGSAIVVNNKPIFARRNGIFVDIDIVPLGVAEIIDNVLCVSGGARAEVVDGVLIVTGDYSAEIENGVLYAK